MRGKHEANFYNEDDIPKAMKKQGSSGENMRNQKNMHMN